MFHWLAIWKQAKINQTQWWGIVYMHRCFSAEIYTIKSRALLSHVSLCQYNSLVSFCTWFTAVSNHMKPETLAYYHYKYNSNTFLSRHIVNSECTVSAFCQGQVSEKVEFSWGDLLSLYSSRISFIIYICGKSLRAQIMSELRIKIKKQRVRCGLFTFIAALCYELY